MNSSSSNFFLNFLILKKFRFLRHVTILIFLFVVIMNYSGKNLENGMSSYYAYSLLSFTYVMLVIFFYVNMYILIPKLLYKKYYVIYLLALLIGVCMEYLFIKIFVYYVVEPDQLTPEKNEVGVLRELFNVAITMLPFLLSSTALKLFQRWISDNERIDELENKALQIELKALKNQINPHFLFNMLNNLNVLIKKDPEKASEVTLKLSAFLRHHLYDNNQSLVFLSSEIKFIEDFLDLEKIRRDDFAFEVNFIGDGKPRFQVPPNIFTVFVENAIKHSLDSHLPSTVKVSFTIADTFITFLCVNSKPELIIISNNEGLGLENVKRRLELLYDANYTLKIDDSKHYYKVELKLPI